MVPRVMLPYLAVRPYTRYFTTACGGCPAGFPLASSFSSLRGQDALRFPCCGGIRACDTYQRKLGCRLT